MRKLVYVLLVSLPQEDGVETAVGPVCWDRIEASKIKRGLMDRGAVVQIVERLVRGEMPEPILTAAPAYPERGE